MAIIKKNIYLQFKKLHEKAQLPTQGKHGDVGFDLRCVEDFDLYPGETKIVATGLQLANFPTNDSSGNSLYMQFLSRSGLASKGVFVIGGVIDATYRGELKVLLHNGNTPHKLVELANGDKALDERHLNSPISFKCGDRIAQFIIAKVVTNDDSYVVHLGESDVVTDTARGSDGFGSTGTK